LISRGYIISLISRGY